MARAPVAAAIVAGGVARRFGGTVKGLLRIGGQRIVDRQLAALNGLADPIFVVANDPAPFATLGLAIVPDEIPGCGALGGIYTAVVRSPCARTLVVAGDMPGLHPGLIERLVRPSDADVVVPMGPHGYEPLCAVYARTCAEPIRRRLEAGALKAQVMPDGVRVEVIGPEELAVCDPDGLLFVNVNTPHEYERARALIEGMPQRPGDRITGTHSAS